MLLRTSNRTVRAILVRCSIKDYYTVHLIRASEPVLTYLLLDVLSNVLENLVSRNSDTTWSALNTFSMLYFSIASEATSCRVSTDARHKVTSHTMTRHTDVNSGLLHFFRLDYDQWTPAVIETCGRTISADLI